MDPRQTRSSKIWRRTCPVPSADIITKQLKNQCIDLSGQQLPPWILCPIAYREGLAPRRSHPFSCIPDAEPVHTAFNDGCLERFFKNIKYTRMAKESRLIWMCHEYLKTAQGNNTKGRVVLVHLQQTVQTLAYWSILDKKNHQEDRSSHAKSLIGTSISSASVLSAWGPALCFPPKRQ